MENKKIGECLDEGKISFYLIGGLVGIISILIFPYISGSIIFLILLITAKNKNKFRQLLLGTLFPFAIGVIIVNFDRVFINISNWLAIIGAIMVIIFLIAKVVELEITLKSNKKELQNYLESNRLNIGDIQLESTEDEIKLFKKQKTIRIITIATYIVSIISFGFFMVFGLVAAFSGFNPGGSDQGLINLTWVFLVICIILFMSFIIAFIIGIAQDLKIKRLNGNKIKLNFLDILLIITILFSVICTIII